MGEHALDATVEQFLASRRPGPSRGGDRLRIVPITGPALKSPAPRTLARQPAPASLRLSERDGQARVEEVQAYNGAAASILALEGELLAGGFQDRMLAASTLIGPRSAAILSTACSEEGRFEGEDVVLRPTGSVAPPRYRRRLRLGLYGDSGGDGTPTSRQQAVWRDIEADRRTLDHPGEGISLLRLCTAAREQWGPLVEGLAPAGRESGWLVFIDQRLAAADLFCGPALGAAYGPPLLAAAAYDGLVEGLRSGPHKAAAPAAERAGWTEGFWRDLSGELAGALTVREEQTSGSARLSMDSPALVGTALLHRGELLHLSFFPALYADDVAALP